MALRRISFASIAVFGLGAFVALAVGVTLWVSAASNLRSTQELLARQMESLLDDIEQKVITRLQPVTAQSNSVIRAFAEGRIDLHRTRELDAFMAGALGATPQVSGLGIIDASGRVRRWSRDNATAVIENWSDRANVREWLDKGRTQSGPSWLPPLWTPTERIPALLHDSPLHRKGRFVGMLGQVVPVAGLSQDLAVFTAENRGTPFILYGRDFVLAHPTLAARRVEAPGASPLLRIGEAGDAVLERIYTPDARAPFGLRALRRAEAVRANVGGRQYVYVYRDMDPYGPQPWTIGVYLDPVEDGLSAEMRRVLLSIIAGLAVLVIAVLFAALAGRRISRPIEAFAGAARSVRKGRLDEVPRLGRNAIAELDEASRSFDLMVDDLRERKQIRETLGQYVPEQVARELLAGGGRLEPTEAKATVLMCDIEGFTELTESHGPRRTIEFLNAYFELIVGIVERHGGVVTQFQGDAILAVFNVPIRDRDHGANALRAALAIVSESEGHSFAGVKARNRVGISTGRVVAGAVGSSGRLNYTVHGNAVNLAARLEALNKEYGTRILLSGKTAERCPGFSLRKVADAQIRGYAEPVEVYTPSDGFVTPPPENSGRKHPQ